MRMQQGALVILLLRNFLRSSTAVSHYVRRGAITYTGSNEWKPWPGPASETNTEFVGDSVEDTTNTDTTDNTSTNNDMKNNGNKNIPKYYFNLNPNTNNNNAGGNDESNSEADMKNDEPKQSGEQNKQEPSLQSVVGIVGDLGRPLKVCEGHCKNDNDCDEHLLCLSRNANEDVPGCQGEITQNNAIDFCYDPNYGKLQAGKDDMMNLDDTQSNNNQGSSTTNTWNLIDYGNKYLRVVSGGGPDLDRCQGNCETHSDCGGDLVCFQRQSNLTSVPGCKGTTNNTTNYCIDPLDNPSNITQDTFRLKLYWEFGYLWQEERSESFWCLECNDGYCNYGDQMYVSWCDDKNTRFLFINQNGNETMIQVANTNLCLRFDSSGREAELRPCNDKDELQRFIAGEFGNFDGKRFALESKGLGGCLTQQHHPKPGERVFRELNCSSAMNDQTLFWNKY